MLSWKNFPMLYRNKENEYMRYIIKMLIFLFIDILKLNVNESNDSCADFIVQWYKTSAVGNIVLIVLSVLLCSFGDELYACVLQCVAVCCNAY